MTDAEARRVEPSGKRPEGGPDHRRKIAQAGYTPTTEVLAEQVRRLEGELADLVDEGQARGKIATEKQPGPGRG
ncbi:MAG: hypothetical protein ACREMD_00860, partial [Gemmatimonadota bacterium]